MASGLALQGIGSSISTHSPAKRVRGRTEAERIADRGVAFRAQAEEAARHGASAQYVAQLAGLGERDLTAAGRRIAKSTSLVGDNAATSGILESAKSLKNIEKNLEPTKIK